MTRKLFAALALTLLIAACSSTPDSSGTAATDGTLTAPEDRVPISRDDIIFDDDLSDTSIPSDLNANPGTQEDLIVSVGDRVFFGYDSATVDGESGAILDKQAAWLRSYPNTTVTIEGHADERGTREYNLALGERRAQAVKNYLTSLGISPNRLNTLSYGKERPAVLGSNPAAWKRNRRGVMVVN